MSTATNEQITAAYDVAVAKLRTAGYGLYDHQSEGIKWMIGRELDNSGARGGLLCDDPGLGKTLTTLAMIAANTVNENMESNLIVCPVSLLEQWRDAARKVFPDVKIRICHGPNGSFSSKSEIEAAKCFIVITTYEKVFGTDRGDYQKTVLHSYEWTRVICDEVHKIKNKNSKVWKGCTDIKAKCRWGLSGTPIQNNISDLKSLFAFIHISDVSIKTRLEELKDIYIIRRNRHILPDAYKALDITIDDVGFADPQEQKFYENLRDEIRKEFVQLTQSSEQPSHIMSHIFELLLRLRQATIHPCIVYNGLLRKLASSADEECYTDIEATKLKLVERIKFWSKRPSTKISKIIELVGSQTVDDRTLIVSHFTEEADLIFTFLKKNFPEMRIEIFDGSLPIHKRNEMIDRARLGEIDCLIIQIQCGGVGLNLQMFNKVYITTPDWNPSNEIQAIARCHRIGQTKDVDVVKIIIGDATGKPTIDERIISIQNSKRLLMSDYLKDPSLEFNENFRSKTTIQSLSMKDFAYLLK
jgi:SNF2 family DNA or RNA helicase